MTKWFAFQFAFIHVLLYVWFRIFYKLCFVYVLKLLMYDFIFTHFGLFDVAKRGEKNGYFRNQDIIFSKF